MIRLESMDALLRWVQADGAQPGMQVCVPADWLAELTEGGRQRLEAALEHAGAELLPIEGLRPVIVRDRPRRDATPQT